MGDPIAPMLWAAIRKGFIPSETRPMASIIIIVDPDGYVMSCPMDIEAMQDTVVPVQGFLKMLQHRERQRRELKLDPEPEGGTVQ